MQYDAAKQDLEYSAIYRDRFGEEQTVIHNDGRTLTMLVRGIEFSSGYFEDWTPTIRLTPEQRSSFIFWRDELRDFSLSCEIPVTAVRGGVADGAVLNVEVSIGEENADWRLNQETVVMHLCIDETIYRSAEDAGWFEDALLSLQRNLPDEIYLTVCFTCAFSDYHPVGHGMFGCMACFRDNKTGYLAAESGKAGIFRVWPTMTGRVQETWLCSEYQHRQPGTGYRG